MEFAICIECGTIFTFQRSPKGGNIPKVCSDTCRDSRKSRKNKEYKLKHKVIAKEKAKSRRYCKYPGCSEPTKGNGLNYYYCERHWALMTNDLAGDEYQYIDGGENLIEQFSEKIR